MKDVSFVRLSSVLQNRLDIHLASNGQGHTIARVLRWEVNTQPVVRR